MISLPVAPLAAATLSGQVRYADSQTGTIRVSAVLQGSNNRVLRLDGDKDFVRVPALTDLSGSEITIQYWFRGASFQSAVRQQGGGWVVAGWNNLHILSHDGGTGGIAAGKANDGSWHHVMMTWKQGAPQGFASYLDGKRVEARDAVDVPIPTHNSPVYFGAFLGTAEFSTGEMDEIAIWRRAWSPEEVAANWYKRLTGTEEGLTGYWSFDGDTDTQVTDLSPNGYVGELSGDAVIVEENIPGLDGVFETTLNQPGTFSLADVVNNADYTVSAFMDVNGNQRYDAGEPFGSLPGQISVSDNVGDLDILLQEPPMFRQQPGGGAVLVGSSVTLAAAVQGSQPFTYQWFKDDQELRDSGRISGVTTASLSIANAQTADSGAYRLVATNPAGTAASDTVVLAVQAGGATLSGDVTYAGTQAGKLVVVAEQIIVGNQVLRLDGDGDSAETTLTDISGNELTVQYWFRGPVMQSVVRQQAGAGYVVAGWNGLHILSNDGGVGGVDAGSKANDGAWHQVTFTWKRATPSGFRTFLDGKLVAQRDSSVNPVLNLNSPVYLGAFNGVGEFTKGDLDEVAIWGRALSDTEVVTHWNKPLSGSEEGLLAFWNFDNGQVSDLTAAAHDGTLRGNATILPADISGFGGQRLTVQRDGIGNWEIKGVQAGPNFKVTAFLDSNNNGVQDPTEAAGEYTGNPFNVSGDKTGISLVLSEAPRLVSFTTQARGTDGDTVSLTVNALGTGPLNYQWERDGIPLDDGARVSGTRSATLTIASLTPGDDGLYRVTVSNAKGSLRTQQGRIMVVNGGKQISGTIQVARAVDGPILLKATQINSAPDNQVLELDGVNDSAVIPDLKDLSGDALTVLYWFRGSSYQSGVRQQNAGYLVVGWNGQHILSTDGGTGGIQAGPNINDGAWHRVAMTWQRESPGGFASYLDGNLITSRDSGANPIPNIGSSVFFGSFNGTGEFAKGQLDEIAIFNRALSEYEMFTIWNQPLTGAEEGLIGLWTFNDGAITDLSPNARNGELLNGALIVPATIPRLGGGEYTAVLSAPGSFTLGNLPPGANYHLTAFVDSNSNGQADAEEAVGSYVGNPFILADDVSGVVLNLSGPLDNIRITLSQEGANLVLSWPAIAGLRLEATDTLAPAAWVPVEGVVGTRYQAPATSGQQFYRVSRP